MSYAISAGAEGTEMIFIQPGKPMPNGYIERFNRFFREDIPDAYLFKSMHEVRALSQEWMEFYNNKHPHESLNDMSPREYLEAVNSGKLATHKTQEEFTTINSHNSSNIENLSSTSQS
jgi:putative transposase